MSGFEQIPQAFNPLPVHPEVTFSHARRRPYVNNLAGCIQAQLGVVNEPPDSAPERGPQIIAGVLFDPAAEPSQRLFGVLPRGAGLSGKC